MPPRPPYATIDDFIEGETTTQTALAKRLGISQSGLSMICDGQRTPRPKLALKIHEMTGVPLETILRRRKKSAR